MTILIKELDPQIIWKNFYLLTQVPRPSGHLEKLQTFLVALLGIYALVALFLTKPRKA